MNNKGKLKGGKNTDYKNMFFGFISDIVHYLTLFIIKIIIYILLRTI